MPLSIDAVAPISPLLTQVAVGYDTNTYIGEQILPVVTVASEKYTYYKFGRHHFRRYNTKRNIASGFQRVDYALSTATGSLQEFGLEHAIDDRIRAEAQAPLEPDVQGTAIVTEGLKLDQEKRVATLVFTSSNYHSALTSVPTTKWDGTSPKIHNDITTAMEAVRAKIGVYPNTMVLPASIARAMSVQADITDYVKYIGGLEKLAQAQAANGYLLPPTLWGLKIIIAGAIENTANIAQAEVMSDIWTDNVLIAYINNSPAKWKPSLGYIFRLAGSAIKIQRYREERIKSDIIRGNLIQEEKLLAVDDSSKIIAGYLFTDVLT